MSDKTTNFIHTMAPLATQDMLKTKVLASLTLAQMILESAWGESELALNACNYFGIKANSDYRGDTYTKTTTEYIDGIAYTVTAEFKKYNCIEDSIADHSEFLQKDRYKSVLEATDYKTACEAVYEAGYATDPNYSQKLINLIEAYELYQYDETEEEILYYRVVAGSYTNRANAEKQQQTLKELGIDSFIVTESIKK